MWNRWSDRGAVAVGIALALALVPVGPARAGDPGNNTGIEFFIDANPDLLFVPAPGEPASPSPCGPVEVDDTGDFPVAREIAGAQRLCVPDVVAGADIRALFTVVIDDAARNDLGQTLFAITLIVEFEIDGKRFVLADSFAELPAGDAPIELLPWGADEDPQGNLRIIGESEVHRVSWGAALVAGGSFADLRARLFAIAASELDPTIDPHTHTLVIGDPLAEAPRKNAVASATASDCSGTCGERESDESGSAEPLGSVARYRVTLRFGKLDT